MRAAFSNAASAAVCGPRVLLIELSLFTRRLVLLSRAKGTAYSTHLSDGTRKRSSKKKKKKCSPAPSSYTTSLLLCLFSVAQRRARMCVCVFSSVRAQITSSPCPHPCRAPCGTALLSRAVSLYTCIHTRTASCSLAGLWHYVCPRVRMQRLYKLYMCLADTSGGFHL